LRTAEAKGASDQSLLQRGRPAAVPQPYRSRYWLNANPLDPEAFRQQATAVCDLYEQAGALAERGVHVVSTDEKTGIQALERLYPDIPMGPGRVQPRESEYTRTEEDFAKHIEQTLAADPLAGWVFIVDNLNTHQSESLGPAVAGWCLIEGDLGGEGEARGVAVAGQPGGVRERGGPSDPVRVDAQAQFVAEPGGDLVQHLGAEVTEAVEFQFAGRPARAAAALHRLLQPDVGQAHRLAVFSEAAPRGAVSRLLSSAALY
jgi:hypothetical protein